ncbi:hypothetical protein DENIS_1768 [Desulfonema ishimotonii]|uniref:Thioesterase domain-containing protein n=1 Tax=Desulfonema ishimotonii TaxID=45657 RepID=A0A401FV15_9BACT|nr:thioesterase family protein [Desulfonema ishimotonii]GBC60809.1 hypothetical protein DENIS_1768 [Desulfonema ishimotonii]
MTGKIENASDLLAMLGDIYENQMPFDRLLGIKIEELTWDDARVRINMRDELVGNFVKGILHGGVISSVLDLTGGLVASVALLKQMTGASVAEIGQRFTRMGTIDLRVDYLRAGQGDYFVSTGSVLRTGNKVAVIRTEFRNDQDLLIAAGTGSYLVG